MLLLLTSLNGLAEYNRSYQAKAQFKHTHPCPSTGKTKGSCQNYIIGYINPLACGGEDNTQNMQWQTKGEAKIKEKWEYKNCSKGN